MPHFIHFIFNRLFFTLYFLLLFLGEGYAQQKIPYANLMIQNGDLIFVGAKKKNLSGAINRVTQSKQGVSFDHVGIIEIEMGHAYIIHSTGNKGSVREPLDSLVFNKSKLKQAMVVYRLSENVQHAIPEAIEKSKTLLGKPYNWTYVLNDSSLYCSDLIERAFRHAGIFSLEPMTFQNPTTKKTDSFWVEYYQKLGIEIPEGQLGCNPNGLAANDHLQRIGQLIVAF